MAATYTARQGQTWDEIALEVYGDEVYAGFLMQNNYELLDVLIFSAGDTLNTPDLVLEVEGDTPPWIDEEPEDTEEDEGEEDDPYA